MSKKRRSQSTQSTTESEDIFLTQPGSSTQSSILSQGSIRRTRMSVLSQECDSNIITSTLSQRSSRRTQRKESSYISLSQPGPSTQSDASSQGSRQRTKFTGTSQESNSSIRINRSSQRYIRNPDIRESESLQNTIEEEQAPLISSMIRYLLVTSGNKQIIQKNHIIKNVLNGNNKLFRETIDEVKRQLFMVFGYKLKEVENNKYILVNDIQNHLPHLLYNDNNKQVLLFLVLVHIFMHGKSCKEEILWHYLRTLNIITENSFQHEYFGDVKQLVTVDFVNERYLSKLVSDKNDPSNFEYVWGSRAESEITYRSCLEFVAKIYDSPLNKWKFQYKAMIEEEKRLNE